MDQANLNILLREYDTLRTEILERLKLAYQLLGSAGAILAFAIPLAISDSAGTTQPWKVFLKVGIAFVGTLIPIWLSVLNWTWLRNCADQLRLIEDEVQKHTGGAQLLTWERRVKQLTNGILRLPKKPLNVTSLMPCVSSAAAQVSVGPTAAEEGTAE